MGLLLYFPIQKYHPFRMVFCVELVMGVGPMNLVITNDALYRLSYISLSLRGYTASTRYIILTIADICKDFF